ncbi:MAG: TetR/AcrR family transcriptional regulator C-terminal domain-containing protein [Gordonia polyisoprenivorans]|nr:TetR/AcrR family transcriptional regulator C-terminal domain-containing protein [Gordonia polyisoprenivorans]
MDDDDARESAAGDRVRPSGHAAGETGSMRGSLSVAVIAQAALAMVDEQGVASATMRAVAERLGVEAMSLYRHVGSRDRMLDAVVERVVNELEDDPDLAGAAGQDWRAYLRALAVGVRGYARRHPHAFPLVATRPTDAPWINPPLRSVRWVEQLLSVLLERGFSDEEVLFAYRVFNTFLLGYLLLETSAMVLDDPLPGDGSYESRGEDGRNDPASPNDPVPGGLTPTRSSEDRQAVAEADTPVELIDPQDSVAASDFPVVHRLAGGLAEDRWDVEFDAALEQMLDRIGAFRTERAL